MFGRNYYNYHWSDNDSMILACILLSISVLYFSVKIYKFIKIRIEVARAKNRITSPYHFYWMLIENLNFQVKSIKKLKSMLEEEKNNVKIDYFNFLLNIYSGIYKERMGYIKDGFVMKVMDKKNIVHTLLFYEQPLDDRVCLQGVLVDSHNDNVYLRKENKQFNIDQLIKKTLKTSKYIILKNKAIQIEED